MVLFILSHLSSAQLIQFWTSNEKLDRPLEMLLKSCVAFFAKFVILDMYEWYNII